MNMGTNLRKFCSVIVLALVAIILVGCSGNKAKEYASKIYIANHDEIKGSFALPKYVEGNEDVTIEWESSNLDIVTIGEYPEWDQPAADDPYAPTSDLYYKATVVLPLEKTEVVLKAEVSYEGKTAVVERPITVVADTYESMTIEEVKDDAAKGDDVKVEGLVAYVSNNGYAVMDDTGVLYVYMSGHGRQIGDEVVVRGEKDVYNNMPQLKNSALEKVGEEKDFNPFADVEETSLTDIIEHDPEDPHFYTSLHKVKGKIKVLPNEFDPYYIVNSKNLDQYIGITKYTSSASLDELKDLVDTDVELNILIYSSYNGDYSVVYVEDSAVELDIEYTDEDNAFLAMQKMQGLFKKQVVTGDIELPTTDEEYGATIVWESSNENILSSDGAYFAPDEETKVTLTIKTTVGDANAEGTVEVTVAKLDVTDIHDLIAKTPLNSDDKEPLVLIEGVVYGIQHEGYWVLDKTAGVYVRDTSSNLPEVGQVVQVKGFLETYKFYESFNMKINPISYEVLEKDAPETIAPVEISIAEIFELGVDSQEKALEQAETYYGKLLTITGTVRGSKYYWYIDGENEGEFFRLNNLASSDGLVEGEEVKITVMVRDIYYVEDTSGFDNFVIGAFGGTFFTTDAIEVLE